MRSLDVDVDRRMGRPLTEIGDQGRDAVFGRHRRRNEQFAVTFQFFATFFANASTIVSRSSPAFPLEEAPTTRLVSVPMSLATTYVFPETSKTDPVMRILAPVNWPTCVDCFGSVNPAALISNSCKIFFNSSR